MASLSDVHFVALARKVGKPSEAELHRIRRVQLERRALGQSPSMFQLACFERALTPDEAARFERWAEQIERREQAPIEDSDVEVPEAPAKSSRPPDVVVPPSRPAPAPPPLPPPLPKVTLPAAKPRRPSRVLAQSAADFGASVTRCALCKTELDELAILERRAHEVDGGFACEACFAKSLEGSKTPTRRAAVPSKTPTARVPVPTSPPSKTPTARVPVPTSPPSKTPTARVPVPTSSPTPSRRRVHAHASGGAPSRETARLRLLIVTGVILALGLVVTLILIAKQTPTPTPIAASPSPAIEAAPSAAPVRPGPSPARSATPLDTMTEATALEREGRPRAAIERLDAALEALPLGNEGREPLLQARTQIVTELRRRIDRVAKLAQDGDPTQARALARRLHEVIPAELASALVRSEIAIATAESLPEPTREDPAVSASPRPVATEPTPAPTTPPSTPSTPPSNEPAATTVRPSPQPTPGKVDGPVAAGPRPSKDPDDDDDPKKPASWMDDEASSLPWDQAYTVETEHYVIKTSVAQKHLKNYQNLMEAFAKRYSVVFRAPGGDRFTKAKLILYGSQAQFKENEPGEEKAAGFYRPGTKDLHCFHGPCEGRNGEALATLAHESAHQYQQIAAPAIFDHAPTFMTEGLASFFEAPRFLPDGSVLLGGISTEYLSSVRRAIRSNTSIALTQLIRTRQVDFDFAHYAHAWALVHWLFYGPESKKSLALLDWYWDACVARPTTAADFEEGVKAMGYTMPKLEKAWKDWVLALDVNKDPAVLLYEQKTGKKVPR